MPFTGVYGDTPASSTPPPDGVTAVPLVTNVSPGANPGVSVSVYVPAADALVFARPVTA